MRVLVEQTRNSSVLWLHRLGLLSGKVVLDPTGERVMEYEPGWEAPGKIAIATLMGGDTGDFFDTDPDLAGGAARLDAILGPPAPNGFATNPATEGVN